MVQNKMWNLGLISGQVVFLAKLIVLEKFIPQVQQTSSKKFIPEIPIPEYVVVDTYERDYSRTFAQPTSYIHARGGMRRI